MPIPRPHMKEYVLNLDTGVVKREGTLFMKIELELEEDCAIRGCLKFIDQREGGWRRDYCINNGTIAMSKY